jgi:hypothetical protein
MKNRRKKEEGRIAKTRERERGGSKNIFSYGLAQQSITGLSHPSKAT